MFAIKAPRPTSSTLLYYEVFYTESASIREPRGEFYSICVSAAQLDSDNIDSEA
jgi:hypothetical protein